MEDQIKKLRVKIDGLHKLNDSLEPFHPVQSMFTGVQSQYILDASRSLIYAKGWLGKCLASLGVESPYKSGYKTKEDIEPTADVSKPCPITGNGHDDWNSISHIERVDRIRTEIQDVTVEIEKLSAPMSTREFAIARTNAYTHICEARFALGFELQRIKEQK